MPMSKISRFTSKAVQLAKNAVGSRGEVAAPEGGGGFADYAVVSLHCLRIYLEKSYRETLDLLSEMPHILGEIGLEPADLSHHSTLVNGLTGSRQHSGECCCACRRSCTIQADTPPSTRRFSTAKTPANTTAVERITASRRSKQQLSWTQKAKQFWTFTVRPRNVTTHSSAGRSPAATRATSPASLRTKATIGWSYVRNSVKTA
jgi:hypothetical protein